MSAIWIRYWYRSAMDTEEDYKLVRDDVSDNELKEDVFENMPRWMVDECYDYGFERIACPPKKSLEAMLSDAKYCAKHYAVLVEEYQRWLNLMAFV